MARRRKNRDSALKARVAPQAVKERETVSESKRFQVHPAQIHEWKRRLLNMAGAYRSPMVR